MHGIRQKSCYLQTISPQTPRPVDAGQPVSSLSARRRQTLRLPSTHAAHDVQDLLNARGLQQTRGDCAPLTAAADQRDRSAALQLGGVLRDMREGDVERARDVPSLPLVSLAHVHDPWWGIHSELLI